MRYRREDAADDHRSAALDKAISITKTTAEYMRQMEAAPQLTVSGLTGDYRLLADFNGVVLAGTQPSSVFNFPVYPYDGLFMVLEITPKRGLAEGKNPEYLYLPAAEHQIERTLLRVGITSPHDAQIRIDCDELPEKVDEALDIEHLSGDDLPALNRMCKSIEPLTEADMEKLNAVVLLAEAGDMMAVRQLAENLDQFENPYSQGDKCVVE